MKNSAYITFFAAITSIATVMTSIIWSYNNYVLLSIDLGDLDAAEMHNISTSAKTVRGQEVFLYRAAESNYFSKQEMMRSIEQCSKRNHHSCLPARMLTLLKNEAISLDEISLLRSDFNRFYAPTYLSIHADMLVASIHNDTALLQDSLSRMTSFKVHIDPSDIKQPHWIRFDLKNNTAVLSNEFSTKIMATIRMRESINRTSFLEQLVNKKILILTKEKISGLEKKKILQFSKRIISSMLPL